MKDMNVVVILLDSLRRDYLNFLNVPQREGSLGQPVHTPHLSALAADSAVFSSATVNSFPCGPFRRDAWTGRIEFPLRGWGPLEYDDYTHAQALGEAGYVSMFISDNYPLVDSGYVIQPDYTRIPPSRAPGNYQRSFTGWHLIRGNQSDRWWPTERAVMLPCDGDKIRGGAHRMELYLQENAGRRWERQWFGPQVMQAAMDWLEENRCRRFFLWLDCFNTHEPFDPPLHYENLYWKGDYQGERLIFPIYARTDAFAPDEVAHLRAMYAGLVTMMDTWIGRLMDSLRNLQLLEDTLIIFTSDHGFLLGDHGLVGKGWAGDKDNFMWNGIADIPLVIRHPEGASAGREIGGMAQTVDLYATILDAAGIERPEGIDGQSLLPLMEGKSASIRELGVYGSHGVPRIHVTDGRYTLFVSDPSSPSGPPRLFDTANDPGQKQDVIQDERAIANTFHEFARSEMERIGATAAFHRLVSTSQAAFA